MIDVTEIKLDSVEQTSMGAPKFFFPSHCAALPLGRYRKIKFFWGNVTLSEWKEHDIYKNKDATEQNTRDNF
jgi:hypothetical protein